MKKWSDYAQLWRDKPESILIEDPRVSPNQRDGYLQFLGDEWGTKDSVDQFVDEFVLPFIDTRSLAMEIGSGGGRLVQRIAPRCLHIICLDVEVELLKLCQTTCHKFSNVSYLLSSSDQAMIPVQDRTIDFLYSFDTFVHVDQRTIYRYLLEAKRVLRTNGHFALHAATIESLGGWKHFAGSIRDGVTQGQFGSFEYIGSQTLLRMACEAGLECVTTSLGRVGNFYYERDLIALLRSG